MQITLSPHEITTLIMVWNAPDQIELDRDELVTLLTHRLIALDPQGSDYRRIHVTPEGHAVLKAVLRIR
nr:hypothetical protein [Burkholderia ubonensis]